MECKISVFCFVIHCNHIVECAVWLNRRNFLWFSIKLFSIFFFSYQALTTNLEIWHQRYFFVKISKLIVQKIRKLPYYPIAVITLFPKPRCYFFIFCLVLAKYWYTHCSTKHDTLCTDFSSRAAICNSFE